MHNKEDIIICMLLTFISSWVFLSSTILKIIRSSLRIILPTELKKETFWNNRPIVYVINNNNEAYVWQSLDASSRASQHLKNEERRRLNYISILWDNLFNASVVLDLESFLIKYMSADWLFKLQNWNWWLQDHNYPDRKKFQECFKEIWKWLQSIWLAKNTIQRIENSDDFKFSPYKTLTDEQYDAMNEIILILADDILNNEDSTFIVKWWAWTWKTILWIYLLKLLKSAIWDDVVIFEDDNDSDWNKIVKIPWAGKLKIWYVTSLSNLKWSIDRLFKWWKRKEKLVYTPLEVAQSNEKFDLLIVDEAHRLKYRRSLANYKNFDKWCNNLWLDPENSSELDWIITQSKHQILFYDPIQKVRPADVQPEVFQSIMKGTNTHNFSLRTQRRILWWWEAYMNYIWSIFSNKAPEKVIKFSNYEFKLYEDVDKMINDIKKLDEQYGLCRNVAWFAWKWVTNPKYIKKLKAKWLPIKNYDIEIEWKQYKWNWTTVWWINSKNAINEIWCIHTVQWFDLNYCWVIIWEDLKYKEWVWLYVDRENYHDSRWKATTTNEELLEYILNIYGVLCTRWIKWTFIYACNPWVREYLKKYIDVIKGN